MTFLLVLLILVIVFGGGVFIYRKSKSAQHSKATSQAGASAKNEEPDVTYECKICGEKDCICHKEERPK